MLPGKRNLAAEQMGIAYRLASKQDVAVVTWGEAVNIPADAVLETEEAELRSELLEAMEWLRERLSTGATAQRDIKRDAAKEGFSWATVGRAKDALGVHAKKSAYRGGWEWRLQDAQHEDAQFNHSHMSTFEQPVETAKVNDNDAAEDAHGPNVSTLPRFAVDSDGEETEQKYVPDSAGPGCTCRECGLHLGTFAGWRAHIVRGRCASRHQTATG